MRRLIFLPFLACLGGCANSYFVAFSNGYDPVASFTFSLPAIALAPGEMREAFLSAAHPPFPASSAIRLESENPRVVRILRPFDPRDIVRLEAVGPGSTLVHRGRFPFPAWKPGANPVERAAWRASVRRSLRPQPDDAAFRAMSDAEIWRAGLRSHSTGALRVVVAVDRLNFETR